MDEKMYNLIECMYEGGEDMAVLTNSKPNCFVIGSNNARAFIIESNKKKVSKSFLDECKEASKLFKKR